jgi:hypothetical protein
MGKTDMKTVSRRRSEKLELTGEAIDAMSNAQKARLVEELERQTPEQRLAESRPLNAAERAQWRRIQKKMGRPKIGQGVKAISLTVEKELLKRADAYAKRNGLKRTELFSKGLRLVIDAKGATRRPGANVSG